MNEANRVLFFFSVLFAEIINIIKNRNQMIKYGKNGSRLIELVISFELKKLFIIDDR